MYNERQLFFDHLGQTSPTPLALEIDKAEGIYLYDRSGKKYIDLISGISVSNIGHRHPKVIAAIKEQLDKYLHLMVYGEYVQSPQVLFAGLLAEQLPKNLNNVFFVNSGTEAVEGALKLAKRYTGRTGIISFKNAYHGSSHGSLSVTGNEELKNSFRPLLPQVDFIEFNEERDLIGITDKTACVIIETIQGEAGVVLPENDYLKKLRKKCDETGALLILDEIQCGFGRTGKLFAFQHYGIDPDILCLAKGMGGGMPIGAFISSEKIMRSLTHSPVLGHITTFGGHPVSCASGLAALKVLIEERLTDNVPAKENLFRRLLKHSEINEIRGKGLLLSVQFETAEINKKVIEKCVEKGLIVDWFLFCDSAMRIAPPLTITDSEIESACKIIMESIEFNIN
jgi:acetylornithine/N-succinyldiaminopimelate aminotransferase